MSQVIEGNKVEFVEESVNPWRVVLRPVQKDEETDKGGYIQADIEKFERMLETLGGVTLGARALSITNYGNLLRAAIFAGWIDSPTCLHEKVIQGVKDVDRFMLNGVNVDELDPLLGVVPQAGNEIMDLWLRFVTVKKV